MVSQVYAVCLLDGKVVLVTYPDDRSNLPGGTVEPGESYIQTLEREVQEETNMLLLDFKPIGYQVVKEEDGKEHIQLRYVAWVQKLADFEQDPGGRVTGNKQVNLDDLNKEVRYGEIGERIILRAKEVMKI
ncbi:NUDIX domain-containing protein [Candidatus Saccharibacteria bacterium]|nr:NUDIX domain-containing protein [Candidatus Saccharibacteria bacterium]MCB9821014.1 NUDIX domain-containing protein [Candidatus Nomurabacteria bacterium]